MSDEKPTLPRRRRYARRERPRLLDVEIYTDEQGSPHLRYHVDGKGIVQRAGHFALDLFERAFGLKED